MLCDGPIDDEDGLKEVIYRLAVRCVNSDVRWTRRIKLLEARIDQAVELLERGKMSDAPQVVDVPQAIHLGDDIRLPWSGEEPVT